MRLAILIPYYKNSEECEIYFKKLMKTLVKQVGGNIILFIYEDGQYSEWLNNYEVSYSNICCYSELKNNGVSYSRNYCLEVSRYNKFDYIMFLDSDDMIDCDFIRKMYEACEKGYDMIISDFKYKGKIVQYDKRSNVSGICLRMEFIKGLSFNEDVNISEDSEFINNVYERNPKIFKIDSVYYYNYGVNPNSLMMRFERNEIGIYKEDL